MAIKSVQKTSLAIELQGGVDKDGNPTFKKKNFTGIKPDAKLENIYAVAEGIKGLLNAETRDYLLTETSKIEMN